MVGQSHNVSLWLVVELGLTQRPAAHRFPAMGTSSALTGHLGVGVSAEIIPIRLPRGEWDPQLCPLRSPISTAGAAGKDLDSWLPGKGTRFRAGVCTRGPHTCHRPGMCCVLAPSGAAGSPGEPRCQEAAVAGGRADPVRGCLSVLHLGTLRKAHTPAS